MRPLGSQPPYLHIPTLQYLIPTKVHAVRTCLHVPSGKAGRRQKQLVIVNASTQWSSFRIALNLNLYANLVSASTEPKDTYQSIS